MEKQFNKEKSKKEPDKIGRILFWVHAVALLLSIGLILRILWIDFFYQPLPQIENRIVPASRKVTVDPVRGDILAKDGRLLAVSTPQYQVYMDCTVLKQHHAERGKKGQADEAKWLSEAKELAKGLSSIYKDKSANEYYRLIANGRRNGRKYVKIGHKINHETLLEVKELPLFRRGANRGGIIVEKEDSRIYPFGSLARRTIGYVKDNNSKNNLIGLEGKFYDDLHGEAGYEWTRQTDNHGRIHNYDSTSVEVKNGKSLRTTLDIDMQDIADKALKNKIKDIEEIEGGCVIIMDVKTGGIRAMVNLRRDSNGHLGETYNYSIGNAFNPGSVFKLTTLMTLIEDGKVELEDEIPTFYGVWPYKDEKVPLDQYLIRSEHPEDHITVVDALEISSNLVFRYLAKEHYGDKPEKYVEKLKDYGLDEKYDFDLEGLATPVMNRPGGVWSKTSLVSLAIGYSVNVTPLHIVSFYNAIANDGRMMKPYLVEAIEKDGRVVEKRGPEVLKKQICSKATADTLTRALRNVVTEGTGSALRKCLCPVAGKTGTSRIEFEVQRGNRRVMVFEKDGLKKHQGTFVGFFPADDPVYTAIVVVYSKPSIRNFYGGSYAAPVLREIVDKVYTLDNNWGEKIEKSSSVPKMARQSIEIGLDEMDLVPDVKGFGITDALYSIENCGYICQYEGTGKVSRQEPKAGSRLAKGETVKLILK